MAISTGTSDHTRVIHRRTGKSTVALMASLASGCRLDMVAWFTFSSRAIMAISATTDNAGVVHRSAAKSTGTLMASLARRRCLDMITWLAFSSTAVMAVGTA